MNIELAKLAKTCLWRYTEEKYFKGEYSDYAMSKRMDKVDEMDYKIIRAENEKKK